jgi:outer membrane protein assembly factor BamB
MRRTWGSTTPVRLAGMLGVLALVAGLSGCWLQIGNGPEHAYYNGAENQLTAANVANLEERWRSYSSRAQGARSEPMVSGNRVYVATRGYSIDEYPKYQVGVMAVNATTGATLWERDDVGPARAEVEMQPVVLADDELWVSYRGEGDGQCGGAIERLDLATGRTLGTAFVGAASAVVQFGDKIAFTGYGLDPSGSCTPTSPTRLIVRDLATGSTLWTAPVDEISLPAVIGDKILVGGDAYAAAGCGTATCSPLWSAEVAGPIRSQAGSPDGRIFVTSGVGTDAARISELDPATGDVLWSGSSSFGDYHDIGIAVAGNLVYVVVGGYETNLRAFPVGGCGAATCEPSWSARIALQNPRSGPVVAGGVVYVSTEFRLAAFRASGCGASTCSPLTSLDATGGPMSVASGKVFVSGGVHSSTGGVHMFSASA